MISSSADILFGVDVGGTTVRATAVDERGRVVASRRSATPKSSDALISLVAACFADLSVEIDARPSTPTRMGVALPGPVDRTAGTLVRSVNLPFLERRPFAQALADRTGATVVLMTDAEAATWGEFTAFEPRPPRFCHLRIGTGVACGVVLDGQLIPTDASRRTHWEKLIVDEDPDAPQCRCGLRGCLELYASGKAMERSAESIGLSGNIESLRDSYATGHSETRRIVRLAAMAVADAVDNLAREFHLETVAIGGGVVERLPHLLADILDIRRAGKYSEEAVRRCSVVPARRGDDAGAIGAALLARASTFA